MSISQVLFGKVFLTICIVGAVLFPGLLLAATMSITPDTGVYSIGDTFTARVIINTQGATINAADARIRFNPGQVAVVGVSQAGSIFNLWTEDPAIVGNDVVFSGGAPRGYSGSGGTLVTLTLRATSAGTGRLTFQNGSALAADGMGSNVLANMNGATYTVQARESAPAPEEVRYVPAANTPGAPQLRSSTHPEQDGWSRNRSATLSWNVPAGVTEVRTSLTQSPSSIPNQVASSVIDSITFDNLPEGVSYAHVQFRNVDGWGTIARYRLAVSTEAPRNVEVIRSELVEITNPKQELLVRVGSTTAPVTTALVQIGGGEPISFDIAGATSTITLPELEPGYHAIIVEVIDAAGNSVIKSLSFTIQSFTAPVFVDVPTTISEGVVPVFRGQTVSGARIIAIIRNVANDSSDTYEVVANEEGVFQVIPEQSFRSGVFEISARAIDPNSAQSDVSERYRFVVQQPGYIQIGSMLLSVLSIVVPAVAMVVVMVLVLWYGLVRWRLLRRRVAKESVEAHEMLRTEFATLRSVLTEQKTKVAASRKTKQLTKAEAELVETIEQQLTAAQNRVEKEIADIEELVPTDTTKK